jgi:hypothetical protein
MNINCDGVLTDFGIASSYDEILLAEVHQAGDREAVWLLTAANGLLGAIIAVLTNREFFRSPPSKAPSRPAPRAVQK